MNLPEREQLSVFLSQLVAARIAERDAEAESMIREALGKQPDAAYLLVQKTLLLDRALRDAQSRIEQLHGAMENMRSAQQVRDSFIDGNSWGNTGTRPLPPASLPLSQPPGPAPSGVQNAAASGWLGNIAATAAGVAAGAFIFQGIEHLIGHHESSGPSVAAKDTTTGNNFFESGNDRGNIYPLDDLDSELNNSDSSWV